MSLTAPTAPQEAANSEAVPARDLAALNAWLETLDAERRVEWALAPQWSAKLEYNFLDFSNDTFTFGGTPIDVDTHVHLVKAGINYRFGGYGKAPVVANY